ncbi:MAG: tetratricopeptide repeat protein [Polyangiales bacterium]
MADSNQNDILGGSGFKPGGGAAILAPPTAFPNGQLPPGAMIVVPIGADGEALPKPLVEGPVALTQEQMWKLLGFNGPAVQVQDQEGRPVLIGLEDLLGGLEQMYKQDPQDTQRARVYAQELIKHERFEKAEQILGRMVAKGGDADDWLALGVVQTNLKKLDKAEGTLKGAANLAKESPIPFIHLAKVYEAKGDKEKEKEAIIKAIDLAGNFLDAWIGLYTVTKNAENEAAAEKIVEELANQEKNKKFAAPYIALQGFYVNEEATREKALVYAKKACERDPNDPMALLCLSAIYGQKGQLDEVEKVLRPHESKMLTDVRLANNYFECLWQSRQIEKVTRFLNTLVRAENAQVKAFAQERAQGISKILQQLQQQAQGAAKA